MENEVTMQGVDETILAEPAERLRASDYLWRPWYARLWWAAIPVYWIGMAASSHINLLAEFYDLALAGYLNVFFFSPMVFMILGFGFARAKLDRGEWVITPPSDQSAFTRNRYDPYTDPNNPLSGPLYRNAHKSLNSKH